MVDQNVVTRGSQNPKTVFPLGEMVQYLLIWYAHSNFIEHNCHE